jgi:hypothetical protein
VTLLRAPDGEHQSSSQIAIMMRLEASMTGESDVALIR